MNDKKHHSLKKLNAGFTLIELIVVIAIISLLATLIIPAAQRSIESAKNVKCKNNLRQMVIAARIYDMDYGELPPAYLRDFSSGETTTWESHLWDMGTDCQIQQCPSFHGEAMWDDDRFTGYNYNASYLGGTVLMRDGEILPGSTRSATLCSISNPSRCAAFGDGEYEGGANKFMRSPYPGDLDSGGGLATGGTQGFRHIKKTNVGFLDGHVESMSVQYTRGAAGETAEGCGFLSPDNSMYDTK